MNIDINKYLFSTESIFRCEVSAEAPSFVTAEGQKVLEVTGQTLLIAFLVIANEVVKERGCQTFVPERVFTLTNYSFDP